jgi:hypothetical protein
VRKIKLSTVRWRSPSKLRKQRLQELLGKRNLDAVLGPEFVSGIEARKDLLEERELRLLALQLPVFLLLTFSLIGNDINANLFGISTDGVKGIREVLLVFSTTLGLYSILTTWSLLSLKEMLTAAVEKAANKNGDLKDFLEVRYGLSDVFSLGSYSDELKPTWPQLTAAIIAAICLICLLLMLAVMSCGVHILNLVEVYRHPNFSPLASTIVVSYVVLGDIGIAMCWIMWHAVQPYKSYEDADKLARLLKTDPKAGQKIIKEIVDKHQSKGRIRRVLTRPKMPRLP